MARAKCALASSWEFASALPDATIEAINSMVASSLAHAPSLI
jgi:hypothetical protein